MAAVLTTTLATLALTSTGALAAQPPVGLGTADSYAVIAGSEITNTGPSTINGDVGLSPGTGITGFPPGTVNGTIHAADAAAAQATSDLTIAYNDAAGRTPALAVPSELGGLTLTSGVYRSPSAMEVTGTLTLDAQGDPDAVFILKAASSLVTASGSRVSLINGAQACNVFWQVGSSATLGTSSVFAGNILALTSISMKNAVTVQGRALARNGAVTLINDTITVGRCTTGSTPGAAPGAGPGAGPGAPGSPRAGLGPRLGGGSSLFTTTPRRVARTIAQHGTSRCVDSTFRALVTGLRIRRVVFSLDGRPFASRTRGPFAAQVRSRPGVHALTARVTFTDSTRPATMRLRYRACAPTQRSVATRPTVSLPPRGPGGFTG